MFLKAKFSKMYSKEVLKILIGALQEKLQGQINLGNVVKLSNLKKKFLDLLFFSRIEVPGPGLLFHHKQVENWTNSMKQLFLDIGQEQLIPER